MKSITAFWTTIFVASILLTFYSCSKINSFEGEVRYQVKMIDHVSALGSKQMEEMLGSEHVYFFSKGRYKSIAKGSMTMNQYYLGGDTLFNEVVGNPDIMWHDVTQYDDEIVDFRIDKDVEEINGVLCSLLYIDSKKGVVKYYYNEGYGLNPKHYKNHQNSFWNFCAKKTKSLPVKWVTDTEDYFIDITATSFESKDIPNEEFSVPNYPRSRLE